MLHAEVKILIVDPEQDLKKVLRLAPPFPQSPHLVPWLLQLYDPSGEVSIYTHQLMLLDGDQQEVGPLLGSSQLHQGRRLKLVRVNTPALASKPVVYPAQSTAVPTAAAVAADIILPMKRGRTEAEYILVAHHQQEEGPKRTVGEGRFFVEPQVNTRGGGEEEREAAANAQSPPPPPPRQRSLENAVAQPPIDDLVNAVKPFKFLEVKDSAKIFNQLSFTDQLKAFGALLRVVSGAGPLPWPFNVPRVVAEVEVGFRLKAALSAVGIEGVCERAVLREAFIRRLIEPSPVEKHIDVGAEFTDAADGLLDSPTFDMFLRVVIRGRLVADPPGKGSCCVFSEDGRQIIVRNLKKFVGLLSRTFDNLRYSEVREMLLKGSPSLDNAGGNKAMFCFPPEVTHSALNGVRLLLEKVASAAKRIPRRELTEMMHQTTNPLLAPHITSIETWSVLVDWAVARQLLSSESSGLHLTPWSTSLGDSLLQNVSTLDLRISKSQSWERGLLILPIMAECSELRSSQGMKLSALFTKCEEAGIFPEEPLNTFCHTVCYIAKIGLLVVERSGHPPPLAVPQFLDLHTCSVRASPVMQRSIVLSNNNPSFGSVKEILDTLSQPVPEPAMSTVLVLGTAVAKIVSLMADRDRDIQALDQTPPVVTQLRLFTEIVLLGMLHVTQRLQMKKPLQVLLKDVFYFLQSAGLVTWRKEQLGFVVTEGLFDAMYCTFLLRVEEYIKVKRHTTAGEAKEDQQNVAFIAKPALQKYLLEDASHALGTFGGIRNAVVGKEDSFGCFFCRAIHDGIITVHHACDGDEASNQTPEKERKRVAKEESSDTSFVVVMEKLASECDRLTSVTPAVQTLMKDSWTAPDIQQVEWMAVPCGMEAMRSVDDVRIGGVALNLSTGS